MWGCFLWFGLSLSANLENLDATGSHPLGWDTPSNCEPGLITKTSFFPDLTNVPGAE